MPSYGRRIAVFVLAAALVAGVVIGLRGRMASAQDAAGPSLGAPQELTPPPTTPSSASPSADPAGDGPVDPNTEVLTRGVVHEAFAQPVVFNPTPSVVVPEKPPEAVEEMPPEQKPAGDHVTWIPGYWTWEGDQKKYVWTSGIWRSMPSGVEWVPGYWTQADGGYQWVCGFWRKNEVTEVTYLPEKPPETLENGAVGQAPGQNYVWIPGVWVWRGVRYAWRPGFWAPCNPDWIWVPAYYSWTPSGYVFIDGHWDYVMDRRGVIFAPVVFRPGVVFGAGYVYTPMVAMDFNVCTGCLFCQPACGCYCFGDYYGPAYVGIGIYPWFSFHRRYGYDPCFAYYDWHYGPRWRERIVVEHRFRLAHIEARPARTFVAMRIGGPALAVHINVLAGRRGGAMHFERVSAIRRAEIHRAVREQHVANMRRAEIERNHAGGRGTGPIKASIPKSSVAPGAHNTTARTNTMQRTAPTGRNAAGRMPTRTPPRFAPRAGGKSSEKR